MSRVQILVIWGLATVSPFSFAQVEVTKGNQRTPYHPPFWFVQMAQPEVVPPGELDHFIVGANEGDKIKFPRVPAANVRYACNPQKNSRGVLVWQFCEM